MESDTRIDSRGGVLLSGYAAFDPPPDPFDPPPPDPRDMPDDPFELPPDIAGSGSLPGGPLAGLPRDTFAERRELFAYFLDDVEAADRQVAVTMAARARHFNELRCVAVSIAAQESAEDAAKPAALRAGRGTESGWSIKNRATTELVTEVAMALTISKNAARTLLAESETLVTDLPITLAALEAGGIRYEHAHVLATTAWSLPKEARAGFEAELLPFAATMILSTFRAKVLAARERLDTESMAERHEKAAAFRHVTIELGESGMGYLTLHDSNEVLAGIFNRITDIALPNAKNDPRTLAQRRADVATEILLKGDLCGDDTNSGDAVDENGEPTGVVGRRLGHAIVAQVHVEIPVLTLLGIENMPATLEGRAPIDAVTARKLVADSPGFFRLLTDPITGSIIAFDDRFRHFPASLRRAVRLIDGKCTAPWCDAPPGETHGHHPDEWHNTHNTSLDNAALACGSDHRLIHNTRWTMRKLAGGDKEWTSPCGRVKTVPPNRRLSPAFVEALKPDGQKHEPNTPSEAPATDSWNTMPPEGEEMPF